MTATTTAAMRSSTRRASIGPPSFHGPAHQVTRLSAGLRLPEDLVNLADEAEQLLTLGRVERLLRVAGRLGGPPEQVVELGVLLEVRRLEVVGPQHPQVVLDQVGPLLLDLHATVPEDRVRSE